LRHRVQRLFRKRSGKVRLLPAGWSVDGGTGAIDGQNSASIRNLDRKIRMGVDDRPTTSALDYNPEVKKIIRSRVTQIFAHMIACSGTVFFLGSLQRSAVAQDSANFPYMSPQLPPEQRATDLLLRMPT
jgi:hypothetical protein